MKHYPTKATQSKLTYDDVRAIRKARKKHKVKYTILAQLYDVSITSIKDIVLRYTYRYVTDEKEGK